jgi:hypothetical protein
MSIALSESCPTDVNNPISKQCNETEPVEFLESENLKFAFIQKYSRAGKQMSQNERSPRSMAMERQVVLKLDWTEVVTETQVLLRAAMCTYLPVAEKCNRAVGNIGNT